MKQTLLLLVFALAVAWLTAFPASASFASHPDIACSYRATGIVDTGTAGKVSSLSYALDASGNFSTITQGASPMGKMQCP